MENGDRVLARATGAGDAWPGGETARRPREACRYGCARICSPPAVAPAL